MLTGYRENEARFEHLPAEIKESKYINQKLLQSDYWIPVLQNPEIMQKLMKLTRTIEENQMIHFHKKDIEIVLKQNKILAAKEKFPFGMEYHKSSKTFYFVLKEKKAQCITGTGYFVYLKILQNIHTKNFIARKTEIVSSDEYENKLLQTQKELRILSKVYGKKNISYGFRFTKQKNFFKRLFGFQNHLPLKIDIFMPWIPGIELFDFINTLHPGRNQELLCYKIILATSLELHRLHQYKIIHGDIKPENIKLCIENNEVALLQIFDFNLSYEATSTLIEDGYATILAYSNELHGTAAYLDPRIKQPLGFIYSSKSDTFSLLLILFEMLGRTKISFMDSPSEIIREKLQKIRNQLHNLQPSTIDEANFLSKYVLETNDPYPTLQSLIIFLESKIQKLSFDLKQRKKYLKPIFNYKTDKLGLFGLPQEKKMGESKHMNISISRT